MTKMIFYEDLEHESVLMGRSSQRSYDPASLMPSPILRSAWPFSLCSDVSVSDAELKSEGAKVLVAQMSWETKTG